MDNTEYDLNWAALYLSIVKGLSAEKALATMDGESTPRPYIRRKDIGRAGNVSLENGRGAVLQKDSRKIWSIAWGSPSKSFKNSEGGEHL